MAEKCIELDSVEIAAAVFGNCDRNIRLLENEFSVTAVCRGTQLRLSGEPANVAAASRAVEGMLLLIENHTPLEDQTVRYCISLAHDGAEKRVRELTEDFVTVTVKGRPIRPKTLGQKEYLNAIRNNAITFGVGPAGTGKTYLAVAMAVKAFKAKEVSRIVLTRPAVEAGEKLGFLPGDLQQKVDPYLRPLYDGLFDMLGAETYERLVEKQIIEVAPLAYMRRRCDPDRPAGTHPQRPCGCAACAEAGQGHCPVLFYRKRRCAPPPCAGDHQGIRQGCTSRKTTKPERRGLILCPIKF